MMITWYGKKLDVITPACEVECKFGTAALHGYRMEQSKMFCITGIE